MNNTPNTQAVAELEALRKAAKKIKKLIKRMEKVIKGEIECS